MFQAKGQYLGIVLLVLLHVASPTIIRRNGDRVTNRATGKHLAVARKAVSRSTSSDSDGPKSDNKQSGGSGKTSMDMSSSSMSSEKDSKFKKFTPGNKLQKGWRRWHRTCTPCLEDRELKWREPRIGWICGAYQRARRTFKSECSMHLRNCEDGTMFTKISDRKCEDDETVSANGTTLFPRHGRHFFYQYKVNLSGDRSSLYSDSGSTDSDKTTSGDSMF